MMNKVIEFFKTISQIPRGSGNEQEISNYLVNFAKERNLECIQDNVNNVIIKKNGNKRDAKTLILQAHMDMVCEKEKGTDIDFQKDSIEVIEEDDFLHANKTTLGADNGVGLSMILSVLDDDSLLIPNLECVFTVEEETTMKGAFNIDFSHLRGNHLLSIDGTEEGKIEVSSAGMIVEEFKKKYQLTPLNKECYSISLLNFRGGHSGCEINTDRQNAIKVLFTFLKSINDIQFVKISGGGKSNAIPRDCNVVFFTNEKIETKFKEYCMSYISVERYLKYEISKIICQNALSNQDSLGIVNFVNEQKNGVLEYSQINKNFPNTSNNFANIQLDKNEFQAIISLRSSVKKQEKKYTQAIELVAEKYNISHEITSTAPFFERKENSFLQNKCKNIYENLFGNTAKLEDVHAGLEGGVFSQKKPTIDICVIAPNIFDPHSPQERVSISSINRVYLWLQKILEEF